MKRFLQKLSDMMADAALLEMGVDGQTTAEHYAKAASEPWMSQLKRLAQDVTDTLADAALLEMDVHAAAPVAQAGTVRESLEETFIEVAFAEAADYDDIHNAILREHRPERDIAHRDECQYGDNDICFRHAA